MNEFKQKLMKTFETKKRKKGNLVGNGEKNGTKK